jgi:DNA-binding MurR/RpiR family transcriptional regulator
VREDTDISICLKAAYRDLRPSEQKAADFVLSHIDEVRTMSLEVLANKCKVSQPTIIRMVRALHYPGYKEFRYALIAEAARKPQSQEELQPMYGYRIRKEDKVSDVPERIALTTLEIIENTLKSISTKDFQKVTEAIAAAGCIEIYAVENSGAPASDLATKLIYLGLNCHYYSDSYMQRIRASYLSEQDVAIGISYSGCSKDTVDAIKEAKKRKAVTIVITNFRDSLISQYADILLCTSQEQLLYGDAIFSRTSQMMIVDMIYTGILTLDYQKYVKRLDRSSRIIRDKAY